MIEVGDTLRNSREVSGVTLEEVSTDLDIPKILLEQIEDGNMGAFSDVFVLKDYIEKYAKYLGLDKDEIIDSFNTFMLIEEKQDRVASPYTKAIPKIKTTPYVIALGIAMVLMVIALIWSIRQITIMNATDYILFR